MFMDQKIQYYIDANTSQTDLQIQYNSKQNFIKFLCVRVWGEKFLKIEEMISQFAYKYAKDHKYPK